MKATLSFIICLIALSVSLANAADKPNILFIAADDLRPELSCYGNPHIKTPNFDRFAAKGIVFDRAYCQQPICGPSRTSLMTGVRPEKTGAIHNNVYFRETTPDIVTLSQYFIQNGYNAAMAGKIYHTWMKDLKKSWNFKTERPKAQRSKTVKGFALKENQETVQKNRKALMEKYGKIPGGLLHGPAYECADVTDATYNDGYTTLQAIATMKKMKATGKPFFMAAGFQKPHLDFIAPKKYWDMYNRDEIKLAQQKLAPKGSATTGLHCSFELRTRHGIPKYGPIDEELSRTLLHAYYACASYVDAQVGMMLDFLKEEGLSDNTIVVFWGDHGWHLGDMGVWGKATNYEISARVPMLMYAPGMKAAGTKTQGLVELMDIYPTLVELAGLERPEHIEGKSLVPLLNNHKITWNKPVLTQYPNPALREWAALPLSPEMRQTFFGPLISDKEAEIKAQFGDKFDRDLFENNLMGYSLRTETHRFIAWLDRTNKAKDPVMVELYDMAEGYEKENTAESNPEMVKSLLAQVRDMVK